VVLALLVLLQLAGCISIRRSFRYGDGTAALGDEVSGRLYSKFYIRSFRVDTGAWRDMENMTEAERRQTANYNGFVGVEHLLPHMRGLVRENAVAGDVPLDVTVKVGEPKIVGAWSIMLIFTCVLPASAQLEFPVEIDIAVGEERQRLPPENCILARDTRLALASPLGLVPFKERQGFQLTELQSRCIYKFIKTEDQFTWGRFLASGIYQILKTHAVDRLQVPDVDFEAKE
jgi:hypothetical protein